MMVVLPFVAMASLCVTLNLAYLVYYKLGNCEQNFKREVGEKLVDFEGKDLPDNIKISLTI